MVKIKNLFILMLVIISIPTMYSLELYGDEIHVGSQQIINEDLIISGANVVIDGIVKGDVYCSAANVEVNGEIDGTMMCGVANLIVDGYINNLNTGASTITINGRVENIDTVAALVTINGGVEKGRIASAILDINGRIGTVEYFGPNLRKGENAVVMDDFNQRTSPRRDVPWIFAIHWLAGLIGLLLTAWILYKRHPDITQISSKNILNNARKTWAHGLLGILFFIAGILLLLLFGLIAIKGVLIPLIPLLLLTIIAAALIAPLIIAWPVGNWLGEKLKWPKSEFGKHVLGIVCVYTFLTIPILNIFVWLYVVPSGIGALIDAKVHPKDHKVDKKIPAKKKATKKPKKKSGKKKKAKK
ncbi:hypothetical protein K9M79_08245 [Candidatus Woesearchaeota archaeon]|nr:hypothetical protein [Candidatus Woesearchaeota archaeon]